MALRVYTRVVASATPQTATKMRIYMHRLEQVTVDITLEHLEWATTLDLAVSHLIAHVRRWGHAFQSWELHHERAMFINYVQDTLYAGVTCLLHSDSPISQADPLQFVKMAVDRR